jgi:3-oxoacyl-ACP reductase-like protein
LTCPQCRCSERLLASGYFRAKLAQENLIKASPIPYTIVRATQFFEFVSGIAKAATEGQTIRVPAAMMQPIVSDDVAAVVAKIVLEAPLNGMVETAGPDPIRQDELIRQFLKATRDSRTVVTDPSALYYNIALNDQSLTPGDNPILGKTHFEDWLAGLPERTLSGIDQMKGLSGKVAIVTGASKGIGAGIATALGVEGASVVVNYASDREGADRVLGRIADAGGNAIAVQASVSEPQDVHRLFAETKKASASSTC